MTASRKKFDGFTEDERAAMKEHAQELKKATRRGRTKADDEHDVLAKIAEMPPKDRTIAERLHEIIRAAAPALAPTPHSASTTRQPSTTAPCGRPPSPSRS